MANRNRSCGSGCSAGFETERPRISTAISARQQAALERLIRIAQADTGQSRMTAEFLLSWWNASNYGGFDLTTLWGVDREIDADMVTVFALVASCHRYPDDLGYGEEFRRIIRAWRPALQHQRLADWRSVSRHG